MTNNDDVKATTEENESVADEGSSSAENGQHGGSEGENEAVLENLRKQLTEEQNKYLRLYAEFENFRKRNARERVELIGSATLELMKELLPILDDFERARESNKSAGDLEVIKQGFELLYQKLSRLLYGKGLRPIDSRGETFDAEMHEAIAQQEVEEKEQKGKVLEVVEKGYTLNDKIIRHPKVIVGT